MKKLFFRICYFILPLLILFGYCEFRLNEVINGFNFKRKCLEERLDSIQLLVLGTSHATYGINPDYFSVKAFNLSNPSQSIYYDTRLTLKYLPRMPKLKYVIIPISYFSLDYQVIDGIENWRDFYYEQFWGIKYPEVNLFDIRNYSKIALYKPDTVLLYWMRGFKINSAKEYLSNGYLKVDTTGANSLITDTIGNIRVKSQDRLYNEKRIEGNQSDLISLVMELKTRKIEPIFITLPTFSYYYKYANLSRLNTNKKIIDDLCSKYGCTYYNYFRDPRFEKKDFVDNDHLNFIGAEKFTRILNDEIFSRAQ